MNLRPRLPPVLRHRDFRLYLTGLVLSHLGTHGTFVVMLYHMYELTRSTVQVGLVGAAQGVAILVLSPLGGYFADRFDRKVVLQLSQAVSLVACGGLAAVTLSGTVQSWHVLLCALFTGAASTFDNPVRKAIIPSMVPRDELVRGFAVVNPTMQLSRLVGPAVGGGLIALGGPGLMYALDTLTYGVLIFIVRLLRIEPTTPSAAALRMWTSIVEGVAFVKQRPLIIHLLALDISAMVFAAYRVVLPALAVEVLNVGPTGYGLLAAASPIGALVGGVIVYRITSRPLPAGRIIVALTMAYGCFAIGLAHSRTLPIATMAIVGMGLTDAVGTTLRQAAILLVTPHDLLGRVSSLSTMSTAGGPAIGEVNVGWITSVLGVPLGLTLGGLVPFLYAATVGLTSKAVRNYRTGPKSPDAVPSVETVHPSPRDSSEA